MWQAFNVVELFAWKFQLFFAIHVDLHPNIENYRKVITSDSGIYILIALSACLQILIYYYAFLCTINEQQSIWGKRVLEWRPRLGKRYVPPARSDVLRKVAGSSWMQQTEDGIKWHVLVGEGLCPAVDCYILMMMMKVSAQI